MTTACDPLGRCPQCGYQNGAGAGRCVRCRSILHVPRGCSGACSKCLLGTVLSPQTERTRAALDLAGAQRSEWAP